ncbi:sensor histidine kinase [Foetidibacter luteolus]|uniref:sensor histidine kinase n=1 Tax=Foetidibacter luteolus TaxID=2608880 RepID=UPI001A9881D3|nr:histidine kinase [Foetidibacter luteolus]
MAGTAINAQVPDENQFTRYTTAEGLSSNVVTGIVQDNKGFIWIATSNGLNRFDGSSFKKFDKSTPKTSLPNNYIYKLKIKNGNRLVGSTLGGAFAVNTDTYVFTSLLVPASKELYTYHNTGRDAWLDAQGNYVVSTRSGLFIFDSAGILLRENVTERMPELDKLPPNYGTDLYELQSGVIMHNNPYTFIFSRYDPFKQQIEIPDKESADFLRSRYISKRTGLETRCIWGPGNNLFFFNEQINGVEVGDVDKSNFVSSILPFDLKTEISWRTHFWELSPTSIAVNSNSTGFYILNFNPQTRKVTCDGVKYFPGKHCYAILKDKDGFVWVGTENGLYKQRFTMNLFKNINLAKLPGGNETVLVKDIEVADGKIFLASLNLHGLLVLDKTTFTLRSKILFDPGDPPSNDLFNLLRISEDTLWAGTNRGIYWVNIKTLQSGKVSIPASPERHTMTPSFVYLRDSKNNAWAGFNRYKGSEELDIYNPAAGVFTAVSREENPLFKPLAIISSLAEDKQGNVWIGGANGICRWNTGSKKIDQSLLFPKVSACNNGRLDVVGIDENNSAWLINPDNEIIEYNLNTGATYLRLPQAKIGEMVKCFKLIPGSIWMGTDDGLIRFDTRDYSLQKFNAGDGLPAISTSIQDQNMFYDSTEQLLYHATRYYLTLFNTPKKALNLVRPALVIEDITTSDSSYYNVTGPVTLDYHQSNIQVHFTAINYSNPECNLFEYRFLSSKDSAWQKLSNKNILNLYGLPAGNHLIQIKLTSENNRWPEQVKELSLMVVPPFYQTWWFRLIALVSLAGLFMLIYRKGLTTVREKADMDRLLSEYEFKALHAQMNPHFIFNSLGSIKQMIMANETENASRYLNKFAKLIRLTLEHSMKDSIALSDNNGYLQNYLVMEQLRLNNSFGFSIITAANIDDAHTMIPPFMIQPLAENAIWHGLQSISGEKILRIEYAEEEDMLICKVDDNGVGINSTRNTSKDHHSIGLENLNKRLQLLNSKYGYKAQLVLTDKSTGGGTQRGTVATLLLPLLKTV